MADFKDMSIAGESPLQVQGGEPSAKQDRALESREKEQEPSMPKAAMVMYAVVIAIVCLLPSVGLVFGGAEVSSDSDAAPEPQLMSDDGSLNFNVLADAGDWFDDHFAFRNEWVTAAAKVEGGLFGTSPNESVVYGTDGWLYYGDSVDDFRGTAQLSDRALFDIAHSMRLVQDYALAHDAKFAFTIAPNKNTLYGQNMPYYYQVQVGETNLDRLPSFLEDEGVNYIDARALLEQAGDGALEDDGVVSGNWGGEGAVEADEVLYHARDSHWNNKGAALVSDALMTALGHGHRDYAGEPYTVRDDFTGDLDKMLFPAATSPEPEVRYENEAAFDYVTEGVESNFDPRIETASGEGASGSLVMYRDSFCNSLLPFMAESFGSAYFSRGVPYQLVTDLEAHDADALVIERAERFMRNMAANAPVMPAPMLLEDELPADNFASVEASEDVLGDYVCVAGALSGEIEPGARIAVRVNGDLMYEAFGVCDEETAQEGFQLLVPQSVLGDDNVYEVLIW